MVQAKSPSGVALSQGLTPSRTGSSVSHYRTPGIGSASVWEKVMHNPAGSAWFPYDSAAIFSIPAAFLTIWLVSLLDRSRRAAEDRAGYPAQEVRSETGIGAAGASGH